MTAVDPYATMFAMAECSIASPVGLGTVIHSFIAASVMAQSQVPMVECDECPVPVTTETCCIALKIACYSHSANHVITPGEERYLFDVTVCENCCKWEPDECPGNDIIPDPRKCDGYLSLSFTETWGGEICNRVTGSDWEAFLAQQMGIRVTNPTFEGYQCKVEAPKCQTWARTGYILYEEGRTIEVDHYWQLNGKWVNDWSVGSCWLFPCPLAGNPWIVPWTACGQCHSLVTGNMYLDHGCGAAGEIPCPERGPCEE